MTTKVSAAMLSSASALQGMRGNIAGLVQSQAADTDHDTTISPGSAMSSDVTDVLVLGSAITKQIDAAWAVGTNAGGLDTGAVGNSTWYYVWLIKRSDTGVVDVLYSTSATAPTMPANYDLKRLIGAVKTDGSANIIGYNAYELTGGGIEVEWKAAPVDVNITNTLTTSRRTDTLSVPTSFSTVATLAMYSLDSASSYSIRVVCPDAPDAASGLGENGRWSIVSSAGINASAVVKVRTSASGQVASRSNLATIDDYRLATISFEWSRR